MCEDIQIQYDQTVRDATGKIYQFCYGENGYDSTKTVPVNNTPNSCDISRLVDRLNTSYELGIDDEKVVPEEDICPEIKTEMYRPSSVSPKNKLISKIKSRFPDSLVDDDWTVDQLTQRLESLDMEENSDTDSDDMEELDIDEDDEVEMDKEDDADKEEEELEDEVEEEDLDDEDVEDGGDEFSDDE